MMVANAEDQAAGTEAFEEYMTKAFPNLENKKASKQEAMMNALKEWTAMGPIGVTAMPALNMKGKSKMVSRISGIEKGDIESAVSKVGSIRSK